MSEKERLCAYEWIKEHCLFSYTVIDPTTIDTKNIYGATVYSMKKVFIQLLEIIPFPFINLKYLITDAVPLKLPTSYIHKALELYHPTHAESISSSVAAASIVAKVTRDRLMNSLSPLFPAYSFAQHKGYGTKTHIEALRVHGPSIVHRTSFLSHFCESDYDSQQTIC
jgi:Ribonuclease HII